MGPKKGTLTGQILNVEHFLDKMDGAPGELMDANLDESLQRLR